MRRPQGKSNDPTVEKRQAAVAETKVQQPCPLAGVLVVDEEHLVRIMVQLCLERNGFDVWLARNSPEAISFHRQHREEIDIALIDVRLPGLHELQTLKVMRDLNPNLLVCFMSSDTGVCELEELCQRGEAYCISKPFCLDDLSNLLRLMVQSVPACAMRRQPQGKLSDPPDEKRSYD